jgi:hypothetical protein
VTDLLHERWLEARPPFDGDLIVPNADGYSVETLRPILQTIGAALAVASPKHSLWLNEDWHQHDGFLVASRPFSFRDLASWLASDTELDAHRHGDFSVYWAVYDDSYRFLLRFYLGDEPASRDCTFDLSADADLIAACEQRLQRLGVETQRARSKAYFDKAYGG